MISVLTLLGNLLLASVAVTSLQLGENHQLRTIPRAESPASIASRDMGVPSNHTASAVCNEDKDKGYITTVIGTFTVPNLSSMHDDNSGGSVFFAVSRGCHNSSVEIQAGITFKVENGTAKYSAWCGLSPAGPTYDLSWMKIKGGDNITILASSYLENTATVENHDSGQTFSQEFLMNSSLADCPLKGAGWYFKPVMKHNSDTQLPIAKFGQVNIIDAATFGTHNATCNPMDANITNLVINGTTLVSISSGSNNITMRDVNGTSSYGG